MELLDEHYQTKYEEMDFMMSPLTPESLKEDIEEIKRDIKAMAKAMSTIAVQDERIKHVEREQETLWRKHDLLETRLEQTIKYQASCPRDGFQRQLNWLWLAVVPMGLVLIGLGFELIRLAHEIGPK